MLAAAAGQRFSGITSQWSNVADAAVDNPWFYHGSMPSPAPPPVRMPSPPPPGYNVRVSLMTEAKAEEAIACTVTGALSGEVVATVPVSLGEAVSDITKRVMKLLPPRQRAFDDVESYALTFHGVPLEDEKCVLMIDDVVLEDERRVDAALLARVVAGGGFQLVRHTTKAEVRVSAVHWNVARMSDGTAALEFAC